MRPLSLALLAFAVLVAPTVAAADTAIVLAPLSTLGEERPAALRQAESIIEAGLRQVDGFALMGASNARKITRKARAPKLRSCDGDAACLAELGRLVGAAQVVHGEVGGLGDAQVVYLALVDVASVREIRSTTLELRGDDDRGDDAAAAATRLLSPERYVGTLKLEVDVPGATVFVDGQELGTSPIAPREIEVGSHALRVTHPEFHDFVRFVDTGFGAATEVKVDLQAYPIVGRELAPDEQVATGPGVPTEPTPWYRRWYTIAGGSALVLVTSAIVVGLATDGIEADRERKLP